MGTSFGDTSEDILAMNIGQRFSMQLSISYNKLIAARFVLARNLEAYVKGSAMTNKKPADTSHALALNNEVEQVISLFAMPELVDLPQRHFTAAQRQT